MPTPSIISPLLPDRYYHIYNQGNNRERLFYRKANYHYFMRKYYEYCDGYLIIFAYCLMPNHFHLLVKVIDEKAVNQLRRFFQSYALSINRQEERTGSLFRKHFRRKIILSEAYLKRLVFYIHFNPEKDGFIQDYREYQFSSFASINSRGRSKLAKYELIKAFGGLKEFREYHKIMREQYNIFKFEI
jgi:putative transposase